MKKLLMVTSLLLLLFVASCGASEKEKVFVLDDEIEHMELIYTYKGDKVISQSAENEYRYENLGYQDKEEAEAMLQSVINEYLSLDGVDYDIDFGEDSVTEKLDVDYEKLDFDKAKDVPGFDFEGDTDNGVSMSKTEEMLVDQGYTVK